MSDNPAMTLGGLKEGLTPLELAYAYTTIANHGVRVSGSLASYPMGPVAMDSVTSSGRDDKNERKTERVFPAKVGQVAESMLAGVVQGGTGKAAQIGEFAAGKTGTTENYGDAWFVGYNRQMTVAVWVGYPDGLKQMKTEYRGGPVAGGTYPTEIWHDFMTSFIDHPGSPRRRERQEARDRGGAGRALDADARRAPAGAVRRALGTARCARRGSRHPTTSRSSAPTQRPPSQPAQPQRQAPAQPPSAVADTGAGRRRRRRSYAVASFSRGADTHSLSASQKRQGSSTALVMPIRSPIGQPRRRPLRGQDLDRAVQRAAVQGEPDAQRLGQLARAVAQLAPCAAARGGPPSPRARPAGSSARISTAAPTPSGSHTAFSSEWMP